MSESATVSPVSQIAVCNLALWNVGADQISDITQSDRSAKILNNIWNLVRDEVLRAHPWHFAVKRAVLAPTGVAPAYDWDFAYDLPLDCIRPLFPDDSHIDYIIEGGQILTDESTLNFQYIYRNIDESSWSSSFAVAMSWKLSMHIAYPLTQSLALKQACEKSYQESLRDARSYNGVEGVMRNLIATDWTDQRLSSGPLITQDKN